MRFGRIPPSLFALVLAVSGWNPSALAAAAPALAQGLTVEIRGQAGGQIRDFYADRAFRPLWASRGAIGPEAQTLLAYLESADLDGLKPSRYDVDGLREMIAAARTGDPKAMAHAELALSKAFTRYVRDVRRPRGPKMVYTDRALKPKKLRPEAVLRAAAMPKSFGSYISSMGWMSTHYLRLREMLRQADAQRRPEEVLRRIRLNLDRARLLPPPSVRHIVVDAASARLWYYQAGKQQGTMRVVVGTAETQTPMMAGSLNYAILSPYWNVPTYLARNNIAPKVLAGRSLQSLRMEVLSDWSASAHKLDPATINWAAVAAGQTEIRLRELPGPRNSMGRVKFVFPNDEGIYLHDTPNTDLFAKPDRHLSNGCIRLENAAKLGKWLLGKPIPASSPRKAEQPVPLSAPVPVYLTYLTATPGERGAGVLQDVYARDH